MAGGTHVGYGTGRADQQIEGTYYNLASLQPLH